MPGHGQPPLSQLQLVTVTFAGYPFQGFVESFGDFVVTSQWLAAVTQDFGPITATHLAKVNLPASAFNSDLGSVVLNNVGGALPYPADPTGLVYLFYQSSPCTTGGGYHSTVTFNGSPVAYAVALNCSDGKSAEGVASHEIAEVLTDPYFQGEFFDATSAPWVGEVGDICNDSPWWIEGGFRFTPIWSNTAAALGGSVRAVGGGPSILQRVAVAVGAADRPRGRQRDLHAHWLVHGAGLPVDGLGDPRPVRDAELRHHAFAHRDHDQRRDHHAAHAPRAGGDAVGRQRDGARALGAVGRGRRHERLQRRLVAPDHRAVAVHGLRIAAVKSARQGARIHTSFMLAAELPAARPAFMKRPTQQW